MVCYPQQEQSQVLKPCYFRITLNNYKISDLSIKLDHNFFPMYLSFQKEDYLILEWTQHIYAHPCLYEQSSSESGQPSG